uniref:Vacuolar iron transporter n=1 Tax=Oryza punctata TaxID=4537 RepID=A0A0E0K2Y9_ORYPU
MAIDLGCHVGCASPETIVRSDGKETADPTAAPVVVDDVEAAAGGSPGDDGGVNYVARAQWLRAAVLGANDGLVSVASLMIGVGAANRTRRAMLVSGLAGLVAGALGLAGFGVASAYLGGASVARSGVRMLVGGWVAMAVTYGVLKLFGMHGV